MALQSVDEYIKKAPVESRERLIELRERVPEYLPKAREELKWGKIAYVEEMILVVFAGFKNHIGFYVTPTTLEAYKQDLQNFVCGRGSVQFPHDKALPFDVIKKMCEYRWSEVKQKGVKWKT
ncbi:DUF1801 domain-containing protein [Candidatus Dojkabacteria bacterium]|uniref:DUF1801 domain-containing protein n=1 Tax=Candidatus Dojkabacteria bacterium TaxID=2099670 RepID=A0A955L8V3_9BACT|nr:DUF1801 domain-containing protein [Candidatus Dojkabacteria bacterium]